MGEIIQQVFVDADQGVIHLLSAENFPVFIIVLDGETKHPAGFLSLPAFAQQCVESRKVIDISPLREVKIRVQEGNEDHHDGHQAEGVHDHNIRQQETGDNAGFQDNLDGQQADNFMGAQFLQVPENADGGEGQVAAVAGENRPVKLPLVESVFNAEQQMGPRRSQRNQHAGNIYNWSKDTQT